jgi:uncharacterized membrane protein YhaH (DUF805 family)
MFVSLSRLLFSFQGRIARSTFWCAGLIVALLFVLLLVFLQTEFRRNVSLLIYPPFFWMMAALWVKRLRDRGRSPLLLLALAIPVLGPLYLAIEMGFRRGTIGENQYGPDPYDDRPDYLIVE